MDTQNQFLPKWLYEALRWLSSILLPGTATLLAALNAAWGWNWPIEAILSTFTATETFIGAVFLGSKIVTDNAQAEETAALLELSQETRVTKKTTGKKSK